MNRPRGKSITVIVFNRLPTERGLFGTRNGPGFGVRVTCASVRRTAGASGERERNGRLPFAFRTDVFPASLAHVGKFPQTEVERRYPGRLERKLSCGFRRTAGALFTRVTAEIDRRRRVGRISGRSRGHVVVVVSTPVCYRFDGVRSVAWALPFVGPFVGDRPFQNTFQTRSRRERPQT